MKSKKIKLLMISFHFPPIAQSSGFLRSLKFAQYLDKQHFSVDVISATDNAYEKIAPQNYSMLDKKDFTLHRSLALDASRHLSIRGKYFGFMTWPDKWSTWIISGLIKAIYLSWKRPIDVIWVTFPISSALVIAYLTAKLTNKPLVIDLRDPIWEEETWTDTRRQRILRKLEKCVLIQATKIIFTSPGTIEKYRQRYPDIIDKKAELIFNGYDEKDFESLIANCDNKGKRVFLHSGLIPVYERDPTAFFKAIASLKHQAIVTAQKHEFRLRACGNSDVYQKMTRALGIDDLVTFPDAVDYHSALSEMLGADALMVFQDATCNWQIPAKVFEYLRLQKPILAWTETEGDTAKLLRKLKSGDCIASLSDQQAIEAIITVFITTDNWQVQDIQVDAFSRQHLTQELAKLLQDVIYTSAN